MNKLQDNSRSLGFTLVELLVVIAIIGILIGMTIPAVQSIRESARRTTCQNNLRNLALGMLNYESSHAVFPPGQLAPVDYDQDYLVDFSTHQAVGHLGFVLSFIEQQNLRSRFEEIDWGVDQYGPPWFSFSQYWDASDVVVPIFRCPSDFDVEVKELAVSIYSAGPEPVNAVLTISAAANFEGWTNYLGSKGPNNNWSSGSAPQTGIFFERSEIKTADVTDGLTNTFLLGEVIGGTTGAASERRIDIRHSIFQNGIGSNKFFFDETDDAVDDLVSMYSSRHQGGHLVNFAYADGRVAVISSHADRQVLQAQSTRHGGEVP